MRFAGECGLVLSGEDVGRSSTAPAVLAEQRTEGIVAKKKTAKVKRFQKFKFYLTAGELKRVEKLMAAHDNRSLTCFCRVMVDRVMSRYPTPESITNLFLLACAKAEGSLERAPSTEQLPQTVELGSVYAAYLETMHGHFGLKSSRTMLRTLFVLAENGTL